MRLPSYGRDLVKLRESGHELTWCIVATNFGIGAGLPRVVVTDDLDIDEVDFTCLQGVNCCVGYRGDTFRAVNIASKVIQAGARVCCVHNMETGKMEFTTDQVKSMKGIQ